MRLLISMVNRSRRELNYRAGIVPSGFGCRQQPWRGRAAPQDRRSSPEPAASAAFAPATCHVWSAGSWLGLCNELPSLSSPTLRTQSKEDFRRCLQKSFSRSAAACTGLSGDATAAHL